MLRLTPRTTIRCRGCRQQAQLDGARGGEVLGEEVPGVGAEARVLDDLAEGMDLGL